MGEEVLVESQISDSIVLVKTLDAQTLSPSSVVWNYFSDASEWRLLLAGPAFDALLPKEEARAYQLVAEAMTSTQLSSVTIGEVKIVKSDHPLIKATHLLIGTDPQAFVRAHFRDNRIDGVFIKEMFVIRSA
ncbi:MAG TPA: hypothetical protein VN643_17565 [Pyrinomonadaceae bacterium]|nr:hypothetical protein [Pyrinomonadaceae bacterium]